MNHPELTILDQQMRLHAQRLVADVRILPEEARSLATTISKEIAASRGANLLRAIEDSSPLSIKQRLFFYEDYEIWKSLIEPTLVYPRNHPLPPDRVQMSFLEMLWLVDLYCSFVFAGDGLFEVLRKKAPEGSCVRKCSAFIRDNPIRALRNATAHGNWRLLVGKSIRYWAKKGDGPDQPLCRFEATAEDLTFYFALTRCVAWTSLLSAAEELGEAEGGLRGL